MIEDRISTRQTSEGRSKAWEVFVQRGVCVGVSGASSFEQRGRGAEEGGSGLRELSEIEGRQIRLLYEEFGRLYIARTQIRCRS